MSWRRCSILLAFAAAGCVKTEYDLTLTPTGNTVERSLTVKQHGSKSPQEIQQEADRLAEIYGVPALPAKPEQTYHGEFAGQMPDDIGGRGTFTTWESPFGSVSFYVERFRGNDDLAGILRNREAAAGQLVTLISGWLERELKTDPAWPTLRKFLQEEFRGDVVNISSYATMLQFNHNGMTPPESAVRMMQYLLERGYMEPDEIATVTRAFEDANREDYGRLLTWLRIVLAKRMGAEVNPPRSWKFLESHAAATKSLVRYLETTADYERLISAWQTDKSPNRALHKPEPINVVTDVLNRLFAGLIQLGGDQLRLSLQRGHRPMETNGVWSEETAEIRWLKVTLPEGNSLPVIAYAAWDEPNHKAQAARFGETILHGKSLLRYCLWRRGLTPEERTEWDQFADQLKPGPDLAKDVAKFQSRISYPESKDVGPTQTVIDLLVEAINGADTPDGK